MTICKPFGGPLTIIALTQWLESCEDAYEKVSFERGIDVPDRLKVTYSGDAITKEAGSLFEWWTARREDLKRISWDSFVAQAHSWALGVDWKTKAIEHFYRIEQGNKSIEEYLSSLRLARFVLEKNSILPISDIQFNCHMLYRATPTIAAIVQSTPCFDITKVSPAHLEDAIRVAAKDESVNKRGESSSDASSSRLDPPPYTCARKLEFSETWGRDNSSATAFSHAHSLPPSPVNIGRLVSIRGWISGHAQSMKLTIRADDTRATWTLQTIQPTTSEQPEVLSLNAGEYINGIILTRDSDIIHSIRFETNLGRALSSGEIQQDSMAFRAPAGRRIVGLHGTVLGGTFHRLGAIYAPLLPGEV